MFPESQSRHEKSAFPWWKTILLIVISLGIGAAAISHESFWMDEGGPAFKSLFPTLKDWWAMTLRLGGSDVQMPVYMAALWGWEKIVGVSEFALRSINLPWLVLMAFALRRVRYWPLVCLTSPFVLYYVGELRPYAMQMAAGALAASALGKVAENRAEYPFHGLHAAAFAGLLLACSSLTAAVWAVGLCVGIVVIRPEWLKQRRFWFLLLPWIAAGLAISGFYLFTILEGYRAAGIEGSGLLNVFFGFYEMIGLLGLGPGRNELRASPNALLGYLSILIPAFACIFTAWCFGTRALLGSAPKRVIIGAGSALILPILFLTAVGLFMEFRVLGRHLSPGIPAVLLPIAVCIGLRNRQWIAGALAVCFSVASMICLRVFERHFRDDYRQATGVVIQALAQNRTVWWQADMNAARYYAYLKGGIPLVNAIQTLEAEPPSGLMFADLIIINRPDIHYKNQDYRKKLKQASFELSSTFTGFEVWKNRLTPGM